MGVRLAPSGSGGTDYVSAHAEYYRDLGPLVVSVGASSSSSIFGSGSVAEGHVAVGRSVSAGPLLVTGTVGPSLGGAYSRTGRRTVVVPGAFAGIQTNVVVFPFFAVGAEAFAHLNAVDPVTSVGIVLAFGSMPGALF